MAPKYHPTPLSGGDRKALKKELGKARAMTNILATQSTEMRTKGDPLLQSVSKENWNTLDLALPDIPHSRDLPAEACSSLYPR